MTRREMPPGRVSREVVKRTLTRAGLKPRHADHQGRREGVFVRQFSDTKVTVSVDVDDQETRQGMADFVQRALTEAGYTLEDGSSDDLPRWYVTRPPAAEGTA